MKVLAFSISCLFFLASGFSAKSACSCIHNGKPCKYKGSGEPEEGDNVICANVEKSCLTTCLDRAENTLNFDVAKKQGLDAFIACIKVCPTPWNEACAHGCRDLEKRYPPPSKDDLLTCYKNCSKWDNGKHHNKCLATLRSKNGTLATYNDCVTNS